MNLEIRAAGNWDEVTSAMGLRRRVFCDEQGVAEEAEIDGRDREAVHVVAVGDDGRVLGTCRLLFDGEVCKLGRMAVERDLRRSGIGSELAAVAEGIAIDNKAGTIVLHAQTEVRSFYESCGYLAEGEAFEEEGIEHLRMRKELEPGEPA